MLLKKKKRRAIPAEWRHIEYQIKSFKNADGKLLNNRQRYLLLQVYYNTTSIFRIKELATPSLFSVVKIQNPHVRSRCSLPTPALG